MNTSVGFPEVPGGFQWGFSDVSEDFQGVSKLLKGVSERVSVEQRGSIKELPEGVGKSFKAFKDASRGYT